MTNDGHTPAPLKRGFSKVKLLIQGKAMLDNSAEWHEDYCSVVLIERPNGERIIFDPGCHKEFLLKALADNNLTTKDINYVFLSHKHIDHMMFMGIFENANIVTGNSFYDGYRFKRHDKKVWDESIQMIYTPGHVEDHYSLLVDTEEGRYLLAGDLLWFNQGGQSRGLSIQDIIDFPDPVSKLFDLQRKSRAKALKQVKFVIPGHGELITFR